MTLPYPRRAITVLSSVALLRADQGPAIPHYAFLLDLGAVFRFSPGSALEDDGFTVIVPLGGGEAGAWLRVREPDQGDDLTGSGTVTVGGGRWRRVPEASLAADASLLLSTVNAEKGDWIDFTREDVGAYTVALVNGGPAAGTLVTLPVSARSWARVYFNGVNWLHRSSGLSLT